MFIRFHCRFIYFKYILAISGIFNALPAYYNDGKKEGSHEQNQKSCIYCLV